MKLLIVVYPMAINNFLVYGLAHLSRRLIGELIVYTGIRRPSVCPSVNIFKRHLLCSREADLSILHAFIASIGRGNEQLCFYSGKIRTLVAMPTYSPMEL